MFCVLLLFGAILLRIDQAFEINLVVLADDSTFLGCGSSLTRSWSHTRLNGSKVFVYKNKNLTTEYRPLPFRMETRQDTSVEILVIKNVTKDLAGKYDCADEDAKTQSIELIVLEKPPECRLNMYEFVGPNNCNITPDEIVLTCKVPYRGNKPPALKWSKSGANAVLQPNCTEENDGSQNKLITCNLTMKPDFNLNGSVFVCQTTERASEEQYNCTTKPIVILHSLSSEKFQPTIIREGERVDCNANSSQYCTYRWVWYKRDDNYESRTLESKNSLLIAKKIGLHRCEAQCDLRNKTCDVIPKYLDVIPSENNPSQMRASQDKLKEEEPKGWAPTDIALLILGVLPYFAFGCYFILRTTRRRTFVGDRSPASEFNSQPEH